MNPCRSIKSPETAKRATDRKFQLVRVKQTLNIKQSLLWVNRWLLKTVINKKMTFVFQKSKSNFYAELRNSLLGLEGDGHVSRSSAPEVIFLSVFDDKGYSLQRYLTSQLCNSCEMQLPGREGKCYV